MKQQNIALLALRLTLAAIFLYHGLPKGLDWELAQAKFGRMGFPEFLGPIVGITEIILGIGLVFGVRSKEVNAVLAFIIFVAILGVQIPGAISKGKLLPAGLERDLLILVGHFILMVFGPGCYRLKLWEKKGP